MKLIKKTKLNFLLECKSGLRIGDSKDTTDIGGVDLRVVRRKDNQQPYIPGSSLKGKIRSLLEINYGENADTSFDHYKTDEGKLIERLFGGKNYAAKIIFRDAYLEKTSEEKLSSSPFTDMPYTEIKFENSIDRLSGKAKDGAIRQVERVPAGAIFEVEIIINFCDYKNTDGTEYQMSKNEEKIKNLIQKGIDLLNDDYLGGNGSRGYGHVKLTKK